MFKIELVSLASIAMLVEE